MTYPDGKQGVLVTGGDDIGSSEFLDLETLIWEPKASLPIDIDSGTSVPYLDSFLFVGGFSALGQMDTILFYNPGEDRWELLPQRLAYNRTSFPAFLVPDSYALCT